MITMTGLELLAILAVSWGVARLATRDARALATGGSTPRTKKWKAAKKARKAMKGRGRGAGRYGLSDYTADLWHDSWEDARVRREARRTRRPEGWETQPGRARRAGRWLSGQWDAAWATATAKYLAKDWWETTDECPFCGENLGNHDMVRTGLGRRVALCRDAKDAGDDEELRDAAIGAKFLYDVTDPDPPGNKCQACGRDGSEDDPLVVDEDGDRVHRSHFSDPRSGLYTGPRPEHHPQERCRPELNCPYCNGQRPEPSERSLYDNQPYNDFTGVPDDLEEPCGFSGCRGVLAPVPGSQHFDPDGNAWVALKCDTCEQPGRDTRWKWTDQPVTQPSSQPAPAGGDGYEVYENQPYTDLTGVPAGLDRPCSKCDGTMRPVPGSQHFDADGGAQVSTECDQRCGMQSFESWGWTDNPPAENEHYYSSPEEKEADDRERWNDQVDNIRYGFEYERCPACGGDFNDHDIAADPLGNAAAVCRRLNSDGDPHLPEDSPAGAAGRGDADLVAGKQPAAAPASYFHAERNGKALEVVYPIHPTREGPTMSEVTGLETAIHYAHNLTHSTGSAELSAGLEAFEADLGNHGVSGEAVAKLQEGRENLAAAHACFSEVHSALEKQRNVADAYAATPGAGTREFVTAE